MTWRYIFLELHINEHRPAFELCLIELPYSDFSHLNNFKTNSKLSKETKHDIKQT